MSFCVVSPIKKCRKQHRCFWCYEHVLIGQPAVRIAGKTPDGVGSCHYHPECYAASESMTQAEREGHGLNDYDDPCDPGMFKRGTKELK